LRHSPARRQIQAAEVDAVTAISIKNHDYWIKIVEMLQQNWAVIEESEIDLSCTVFFFDDLGGIFDQINFSTIAEAVISLCRNGFSRFVEDKKLQDFIRSPQHPSYERNHPNGKIYSSGRFWK
jgi:hypothetical protein